MYRLPRERKGPYQSAEGAEGTITLPQPPRKPVNSLSHVYAPINVPLRLDVHLAHVWAGRVRTLFDILDLRNSGSRSYLEVSYQTYTACKTYLGVI